MAAYGLAYGHGPSPAARPLLVIYASLGWGNDDEGAVSGADIGRYAAHLLSDAGAGVRGQRIHLMSPAQAASLP